MDNRETNFWGETLFNREKIGDVQGENLLEQHCLKQKKGLKDDQENV